MKKNKAEEGGRRERPPKEVTFEHIPKREGGASPGTLWGGGGGRDTEDSMAGPEAPWGSWQHLGPASQVSLMRFPFGPSLSLGGGGISL